MKVGYARVSTDDQRLDLQLAALQAAGCKRVFEDHGISGTRMNRPGLSSMMRALRPGQTLVVWRLDRLGRSLNGLVQLIDELGRRGVEFQSLTEELNTSSPGGRLIFHIMAALAEFERALISERTKAGMLSAQLQGRHVGRPPSISDQDVLKANTDLQKESLKAVAERHGVSPRTLQRRLQKLRQTPGLLNATS
ncbi:recombinase family protein [Pseudogemmobacter sonorensis]|uniref:recombinase family protein n=1 Tax=Pseudogemmobacter sonorensis TaxID=2989681 RepID=UPI0036768BF4